MAIWQNYYDTQHRLALEHLRNNRLYSEMTDTTETGIEDRINTARSDICRRKQLHSNDKNNFITNTRKLPIFYHLIKIHKNSNTIQIRIIVSGAEGTLYKMSCLVSHILKQILSTFPKTLAKCSDNWGKFSQNTPDSGKERYSLVLALPQRIQEYQFTQRSTYWLMP